MLRSFTESKYQKQLKKWKMKRNKLYWTAVIAWGVGLVVIVWVIVNIL